MDITDPRAQAYCEKYTDPDDSLLAEIAEYTYREHAHPHMLSGHLQGRLLSMISSLIRPRRILEIGTFTGYSALCLAKGLPEDGQLHTLELREEDAQLARGYFNRSKWGSRIFSHIGNALDLIGEIAETWDLVFIDADKPNYVNYFNRVLPQMRAGGCILADNVLFHGQVLEDQATGKNARAIQAFNDYVSEQEGIERVMLPVRDGIYIIRKL